MKLSEILKNITHSPVKGGDREIGGVTYDSRKAGAGDLFVCLSGARFDGHDYALGAYGNGTRTFLVEHTVDDLPADALQIVTDNTRRALASVSAEFYGRPADSLRLIGITGTKGKTSTSLMISSILNSAGINCAYIGSNGVIINGKRTETMNTTPESAELHHYFRLMADAGVGCAVLEVSSQALAHYRVDGIKFEVTAFTNLSEDHIGEGEHPDFEDYKNSKKRLFSDHSSEYMIYNADDESSEFMKEGFAGKTVSYGISANAEWRGTGLERFRSETALGVSFSCSSPYGETEVSMLSPGNFSVYNGLCAMAVCSVFGVDAEFSANVLKRTSVQGRFEIVEGLPGRTFVIDYSHNGFSLTNALKTLSEYPHNRIICVFGSVGGRTYGRRRELAEASGKYADVSIITSDNPDFEDPDAIVSEIAGYMPEGTVFECITDRATAIRRAVNMAEKGDIVVLAGKGHETYQLIEGKKVPFSEKEILVDVLRELLDTVGR